MGKIIYIAGPIGNGHTQGPKQMYRNVRRAEEVMEILMHKGWSVMCPHLSYHCWIDWEKDMPWERWMKQDMDFVRVSDALFYMKPEIYGESMGARQEYEFAKKLNKTIYDDLAEVPELDLD